MADAVEEKYYSVGWWKDTEGVIRQGSVESIGFKQAKEKGPLETQPEPADPAPATTTDKTAEQLAAEAKAAAAKAAEEAAAVAAQGRPQGRNK